MGRLKKSQPINKKFAFKLNSTTKKYRIEFTSNLAKLTIYQVPFNCCALKFGDLSVGGYDIHVFTN
ncbi:hypothetical protein A7985_17485 [Pseudoalteromonas luteoviolacea]|uniref:Uncharacterized protein n=1 Tax=Pseudoalteromonas luteoviolacea TaxID=43657 RepID=A0A1C0TN67_9GAMM|nr:hypothetical protein A7985_17485 [Pseudoalteromonas luteoviolacea]